MSGILSTISGQFSRSLILGAFFPSAVFVILAQVLLVPLFPSGSTVLQPLETLDPQWRLIALVFATVVLTGLLFNLNIPIIRLFEGYPWAATWIGGKLTGRHRARRTMLEERRDEALWLMDRLGKGDPLYDDVNGQWTNACRRLIEEYPDGDASVLPTRLGNVIRASEHYPRRQYGMSSIPLWPRLIAIIDKEYAASIDEAKASFDFMINSALLSAMLAFGLAVVGLAYPTRLASWTLGAWWVLQIVTLAGLAVLCYIWSIGRAVAWSSLLDGAFDLYRWKLLEQLGHRQRPSTRTAERDLWGRISRQVLFGDGEDGPRVRYVDAPERTPFASGEPWRARLEVVRGVSTISAAGVVTVRLGVTNVDTRRTVRDVVVTDTPPDGCDYLWDSAQVDGGQVRVEGAAPCRFHLLDSVLAPGAALSLSYRAIPRKAEEADPASAGPPATVEVV